MNVTLNWGVPFSGCEVKFFECIWLGLERRKRKVRHDERDAEESRNATGIGFLGWDAWPAQGSSGITRASKLGPKDLEGMGNIRGEAPERLGDRGVLWHQRMQSQWDVGHGVELRTEGDLGAHRSTECGAQGEGRVYRTLIDAELLEKWANRSGDPETAVIPKWLVHGAPLGIELPSETCQIFPSMDEQEKVYVSTWDSDAALEKDVKNYVSFEEAIADAKVETDGYRVCISSRSWTGKKMLKGPKGGTVSRPGLIVKVKDTGEVKRRITIDLRRSGGNSKSTLPEKLILPRPVDATRMMKAIREKETLSEKKDPTWSTELVVIDISDAFTVLPVAEAERKHCLTPGIEENVIYQF